MNKINWKVRVSNKHFWITIIPAVLLCVQALAATFGYVLDLSDLGNKILLVVNSIFALLTILGVVIDPTTKGIGDSSLALTYNKLESKTN